MIKVTEHIDPPTVSVLQQLVQILASSHTVDDIMHVVHGSAWWERIDLALKDMSTQHRHSEMAEDIKLSLTRASAKGRGHKEVAAATTGHPSGA